jgi:LPXTG-motif cell wall-anchored protein
MAAALACGACCAGPLLGLWGATTALLPAAAIWIPPLAGLAVTAALAGYLLRRRRRAATNRTGVIDLGLPGTRHTAASGRRFPGE